MIFTKTARLLTTAAFACAAMPALAQEVEVLHWWTSGSEAAALNILKEDLARQGISWQDMPVAGGAGEAATTTLKARVSAGNPPVAAQVLGMGVTEWATEGSLGDISVIATEEGWDAVVPEAVKRFATDDGKWVAVPVNIHRPNWLWINREIFEEHDLTPPTTWEEFNTVAQTLKDAGVTPLAHGGQPWQDATIFDDVVLGLGGPEFYRAAIHELDPEALGSDTMKAVFDEMRVIRGFVDDNFSGRDWNLATAMVVNGDAAMQLMGDWAKGELLEAGVTPGEQVLCVPAPGTEGSYLFITDFFAFFDVSEENQSGQQAMASALMSPKFQEEFNLIKGSIPARADVPSANFDSCGQQAITDIAEANAKGTLIGSLAHGHAQTPAVQLAIFDLVTEHFNSDMSSEDAVEELLHAVEAAQL
ncbi:putative sugar-binding periplasmic protein [Pseudovibrio japonicus]|uniref:Probable sugar-binding periplasmic protein n=1 Tax=Pseudovibrio japonicus TaxID=366534 RepID=A0ABQ3EQI0_9HYPH|nr:putative sugar-binding periplasmic protein [Pseudovibrio japonicus]